MEQQARVLDGKQNRPWCDYTFVNLQCNLEVVGTSKLSL